MAHDGSPAIETTAKTLEILDVLVSRGPCGVSEIADELDMARSTTHHHLRTLEHYEFVVNEDGRYRAGLRFLDYGERIRTGMDLYGIARPEVQELAERTGELVHLLVPEHGRGVILFIAKGEEAVHVDTHVGERLYLHQTALGKSILAHRLEEEVAEIVDTRGLPSRTDRTITSRERLEAELETVRQEGYAVDRAEWQELLWCVAAPIQNDQGEAIGAISVSGPEERIDQDGIDEDLIEAVTNATKVIEIKGSYT